MPTPTGWRLLASGIVALVAGRAVAVVEFYVIGATAISAVVIALAVRLVHPSRLSLSRRVSSEMVAVSEVVEVTLLVTNLAGLPSPTVRLDEQVSGAADASFSLAPVPGASTAASGYRLQPARRGVLEIGPTIVSDIDGPRIGQEATHLRQAHASGGASADRDAGIAAPARRWGIVTAQ